VPIHRSPNELRGVCHRSQISLHIILNLANSRQVLLISLCPRVLPLWRWHSKSRKRQVPVPHLFPSPTFISRSSSLALLYLFAFLLRLAASMIVPYVTSMAQTSSVVLRRWLLLFHSFRRKGTVATLGCPTMGDRHAHAPPVLSPLFHRILSYIPSIAGARIENALIMVRREFMKVSPSTPPLSSVTLP